MFDNRMPFWCPSLDIHMHVNSTDRSKTNPQDGPGIFVGYNLKRRAYRVLEPGQMKFSIARSVVFDEVRIVNRISKIAQQYAQPKAPSETEEVIRPELYSNIRKLYGLRKQC